MNLRRLMVLCSVLVLIVLNVYGVDAVCAEGILHEGVPAGIKAETAKQNWPSFSDLVKKVSPAVVNISVEAADVQPGKGDGNSAESEKQEESAPRSLGSGFIIDESGYVVTNNHVVDKSDRIIVRLLDDKTEYEAKLVGQDQKTDLALLKISTQEKLPFVYIGNSDNLEVGDWVFAIGNQFQLGNTVSAGIVSALVRKVRSAHASPYDAFIQTDASINPGSSGGPLINTQGQVIGINTAIYSPGRGPFGSTGFNIGIGFAIPINLVKRVVAQLKESGKVTRALLGVIIQPVDKDIAGALDMKESEGALVSDVMDNSPASAAGFAVGDVILKFDGKKIRDYDDLPVTVGDTPVGKTVNVEVLRNGERRTLVTTVSELKDAAVAKTPEVSQVPDALGLITGDVTLEISQLTGQHGIKGVVVLGIEAGSPAAKAGLDRGDIISEIAGRKVKDLSTYSKIVSELSFKKPFLVLITRKEGTRFVVFKAKKEQAAKRTGEVP